MATTRRTRTAVRRAVARLYARLSRATDESTSIDTQITSGAAFADAHGWDVVGPQDAPADAPAYVDDGVSGATALDKRDGMSALLADAQRGDKIVARSVDRFARSLKAVT